MAKSRPSKRKKPPAKPRKGPKARSKSAAKATPKAAPKGGSLASLIRTVHHLRAPGGCPWDRAQTHQSLRPYLIEEAYEVLDVLDRVATPESLADPSVREPFREELGDLLMQVLLHSEMASEAGAFDIHDVAAGLDEKLIRRHPHVFGDEKADSAESAFQNWERQKAKEKAAKSKTASVLDGLPKGLPALQKAARILEKVTKVGFQWSDMTGPLGKIDEEVGELRREVLSFDRADADERQRIRGRVEAELGDVFFTLCNLGYLLGLNPEDGLRSTLARFERRFRHVERSIRAKGKALEESNLQEMDVHWDEAKALEKEGLLPEG